MELSLSNTLLAGDPRLIDHIVGEVKSQGIFDQFRKECIADVDTKPAYQNLRTRVEGSVNTFLGKQLWRPDLNKNQVRETLRKHIHDAPYLDAGVERIVDQVVNPKVYSVFMPQIEDVVYKFLGIERPKVREKNGTCGLKDLLPKDLDPVSPESDKNSLKDVSLESVDGIDDMCVKKDELYAERSLPTDICEGKVRNARAENGHNACEDKQLERVGRPFNVAADGITSSMSVKPEDKLEEDEEDSPTFEPIDIMNLNESNISNDSHLSGISELTSHRSRTPDFCNDLSRDNFDCSNQDSQLSKVSSDSRLSIVTDIGSSNHASTPIQDMTKEDACKDKVDLKGVKEHFTAIREFEPCKAKSCRNSVEAGKSKDTVQEMKDSKDDFKNVKSGLCSKENSRDVIDSSGCGSSGGKDKHENKNYKDRNRDVHTSRSKLKEKGHAKEPKHRDRSGDKRKESAHIAARYEKAGKGRPKDKGDVSREHAEISKDLPSKVKDDRMREVERKESSNKEARDLKDLYKEKIRELREKKELTEKEKLSKDSKEMRTNKESSDRRDSPKEKKSLKREHKGSSSKNSTFNSHDAKANKSLEKGMDEKERKGDSRDRGKREEKRLGKEGKTKSQISAKAESGEKPERQEFRKSSKSEKEERVERSETKREKANGRKEVRNHAQSKSWSQRERTEGKKEDKNDTQGKEKKRKEEKKSKPKDDHFGLRKNSNDRRSTDRDGSNGSSGKSSQPSGSNATVGNGKASSSTLSKDANHVNNSSSETSDSIEEAQVNESRAPPEESHCERRGIVEHRVRSSKECSSLDGLVGLESEEAQYEHTELESAESSLPLKKRPLVEEDGVTDVGEVKVKKPKFAKNIHEAKKLMKIRKQMEKRILEENQRVERKMEDRVVEENRERSGKARLEDFESVPDEERVQIIEIPDEEYEEPYPEKQPNLTLEERSMILLEGEPCTKGLLEVCSSLKLRSSDARMDAMQSPRDSVLADNNRLDERIAKDSTGVAEVKATDSGGWSVRLASSATDTVPVSLEDDRAIGSKDTEKAESRPGISEAKYGEEDKGLTSGKPEGQHRADSAEVRFRSGNDRPIDYQRHPRTSACLKNTSWDEGFPLEVEPAIRHVSRSIVEEDREDCRYFKTDSAESERFSSFLASLELVESSSLEDMIESLGGRLVSSAPKAMAPPLPKRKHSSSPLTDILLNNSNNNNDRQKKPVAPSNEEALSGTKKRKVVNSKKPRLHANSCPSQGIPNGENFVMPLSPESDVSATSEKIPSSNLIKEEKGRHRSSQRYSSDDLYKPRPLFSSSSRRSRRSNQA
ncbi:hypothetical protein KM043_003384 [Ampulex compressa]|nr:hypothetical protein KM043_003384 [Ampulex compressa]